MKIRHDEIQSLKYLIKFFQFKFGIVKCALQNVVIKNEEIFNQKWDKKKKKMIDKNQLSIFDAQDLEKRLFFLTRKIQRHISLAERRKKYSQFKTYQNLPWSMKTNLSVCHYNFLSQAGLF